MTALIRSELLAVRTLRTTYIVPIALLALVGLIVGASMADAGKPGTITPDQLREPLVITAGIMSAVFVAVFAVIRVGGEYRYETISQRFLAASRARVLIAKLVTYAGLAAVLSALAIGLGLAIAAPVVSAKDLTLDYSGADVVVLFASVLLGAILFAALGVAIAFICRSQPAALLVVIGLFPAEKVLGILLDENASYMPYGLLQSLLDQGNATPVVGAIVLTAVTAVICAAAWMLLERRDVT
jgi:ABC-type transport system involved in multi-copper enzyme maturation permease subunit